MPHTTSRHGCYTLAKRSGKSISSKERESGRAGQGDWGTLKKRLACSGASPKLSAGGFNQYIRDFHIRAAVLTVAEFSFPDRCCRSATITGLINDIMGGGRSYDFV
ncbi:hypothetical protein I7I50_05997 [Histoplasma capsulatum G186AR]|uniref:Uncharacterized protein n=1 Tax=Ajellomyces capsulatus TaxID=5037 RepID=A0A8H7YYX2_AJECA|nr:hypothetical protein I7I52_08736 [Histoplasma capsulatum]QSS67035.1 hypothetical protein I7I50_05997 [Histoplasma capsulatum G186AR]